MGELLDDFLRRNKKSRDTIGKTLYRELLQVEEAITKREKNIAAAEKTLKENQINIKSISDSTDISRKTFYNNELLASFVEEHSTVDKGTRDENKRFKDKIEELNDKIAKMIKRDIDQESLKHSINTLEAELIKAYRRIETLEKLLEIPEDDSGDDSHGSFAA